MDKAAVSNRFRISKPLSPHREVTIEREICSVWLRESEVAASRRLSNCRAATSSSLIRMRNSLTPIRPMQSSLLVRVLSSHEKCKTSAAPMEEPLNALQLFSKLILIMLKLNVLRAESAS